VADDKRLELADQLVVQAELELCFGPVLDHDES